jgi:hypothetical protein
MKYVNAIFWDNWFPIMTSNWKPNNYMILYLFSWCLHKSCILICKFIYLNSIANYTYRYTWIYHEKGIICQLYLICFSQMQIVPLLETTIIPKKIALNSELFVCTYSSEDVNVWWKAYCWRTQSNRWLEICMHL